MIKARLAPSHTDSLKTLLNKPLARTFDHTRAKRKLLLMKTLIVNMTMMALKIGLSLE